MTEADRLRCQLVATLRGAIDHEQAKAEAGSSADLAKLVTAVEALTKLLPANVTAAPTEKVYRDPRERMVKLILGAIRRPPVNAAILHGDRIVGTTEATEAPPQRALPPPSDTKPDAAASPSEPPAPQPPASSVGPLEDLLSARPCDNAGGSAGFRVGPATEPWRDYLSGDDGRYWGGEKGRSW